MELNKQQICSKCAIISEKLLRCSRCQLRYYCSKDCQIKDWKNGHKDNCKPLTNDLIIIKDMTARLQNPYLIKFQKILRNAINPVNSDKIRYLVILFIEAEGRVIDNLTEIYFGITEMDRKEFLKTVSTNIIDLGREDQLSNVQNVPYISVRFISKSYSDSTKTLKLSYICRCANYLWENEPPKSNIGSTIISNSFLSKFPNEYHTPKDIKDTPEVKQLTLEEYRMEFNKSMQGLNLDIKDFEDGKYFLLYKENNIKRIEIEENPHIPNIIKLKLGANIELKF